MNPGYYKTKDSVEEYIRLAKDVNGRALIDIFRTYLQAGSSVLELGTGPGTDWNILKNDFDVTGSDNSEEFIKHLVASNPNGRFIEIDGATINADEKFDGIYSNKVLHHLTDAEFTDSIKRQYEVLNDNGIICHSFWKGEGSEVFKRLFVNYHTTDSLRSFFEEHFEVLFLDAYAEFDEEDSLLLIGRKK